MCIYTSLLCLFVECIVVLLRCRPIHHNWQEPLEKPEYCYPLKPTIIALAGLGLVIDGVIWTMPHRFVWKLQLRPAHRFAITSIFALGLMCDDIDSFVCQCFLLTIPYSNIVVGISRIAALADLSLASDVTYHAVPAII
jgi:hypothetical protein